MFLNRTDGVKIFGCKFSQTEFRYLDRMADFQFSRQHDALAALRAKIRRENCVLSRDSEAVILVI